MADRIFNELTKKRIGCAVISFLTFIATVQVATAILSKHTDGVLET